MLRQFNIRTFREMWPGYKKFIFSRLRLARHVVVWLLFPHGCPKLSEKNSKDAKISAVREGDAKAKKEAAAKELEAEKKMNEAIAKKVADKKAAAAAAEAEAKAAEEAPAEEAPAEA